MTPEEVLAMSADIPNLDDYRKFDVGTPTRCWKCGSSERVSRHLGDGGYVWGCHDCGHPAD